VHAETDQQLHHDDVDRHRGQAGEAEVGEPLQRQSSAPEGPQFVQDVVGYEGDLDRGYRGRQQREPEQPVQHEQGDVVDDDTADSHQGEPAQPVQVGRHAVNRADVRRPSHHAGVLPAPGPSASPVRRRHFGSLLVVGSLFWVDRAAMSTRILIADDHAMVREGLYHFLSQSADLEPVGAAADGRQAVTMAHELRPDIVLMDLLMPVLDGISATAVIRRELPEVEVVALSGYLEPQLIADALHAGAVGYLLKDTDADEMHRAVRAAAAGQVQLSPAVAARLVRDVHVPSTPPQLTRREEEVLALLARGRANGQIARELHIAPQTVKTHVSNILQKLNAESRTQAALYAMRVGLVPVHAAAPA
jgi:NarL family two-component system response regulator LiaR